MSKIHEDRLAKLLLMSEENEGDTFLLFALAKEYDALGDSEKAIASYQKLISIDRQYIGAYYHLADCQHRAGQVEAAKQTVDAGVLVADELQDGKNKAELLQLMESF